MKAAKRQSGKVPRWQNTELLTIYIYVRMYVSMEIVKIYQGKFLSAYNIYYPLRYKVNYNYAGYVTKTDNCMK